jgi:hypothetical protein
MSERWNIDGEYFESCNCELLCPCLLVKGSRPTDGHCDVVVAVHVDSGKWGQTDLSGLNAVVAIYSPGIMTEGNWTVEPYIDARASEPQRAALEQIISARAGGALGRFEPLIAKRLPAKVTPITFTSEGRIRKLSIPNVAEVTVEGVLGADSQQVWFDNVAHFANRRLAAAKSTSSHFKDQAFSFENSGRNGHFAPIKWSNA